MALSGLSRALRCLSLTPALSSCSALGSAPLIFSQVNGNAALCPHASVVPLHKQVGIHAIPQWRGFHTSSSHEKNVVWKIERKYTIRPIGMKKTGGRDHTGRIRVHGIGGGHKQRYRMIDFQRLNYEPGKENAPFEEKVIQVRYDPCSGRSLVRRPLPVASPWPLPITVLSQVCGHCSGGRREAQTMDYCDRKHEGRGPHQHLGAHWENGSVCQGRRFSSSWSSACWHFNQQPGAGTWQRSPVHSSSRDMWHPTEEGEWNGNCTAAIKTPGPGSGDLHGYRRKGLEHRPQ
ncbi:large ribosomal subunit protein uL2m isoform X2 [Pleurodeles waltl]|uniref:large ribosomal subunit protein uL2m isoform X2 n=1 Tax=Pleurodeles waltl TaxID=8319 RepID=UPI0037094CEF